MPPPVIVDLARRQIGDGVEGEAAAARAGDVALDVPRPPLIDGGRLAAERGEKPPRPTPLAVAVPLIAVPAASSTIDAVELAAR